MFNLDARIDFDEVALPCIVIVKEFCCPCADITNCPGQPQRGLAERLALVVRKKQRGGAFNDLLVPALNRTIPFKKMNDVAMCVAE